MLKRELKELHYGQGASFFLHLDSELLPFSIKKRSFREVEHSNVILQKFVSLIEKKFDSVWYIGTDYFEDDLYERFMFHHGGFMEISLNGKMKCFFLEDKGEKMKGAIMNAVEKLSNRGSALHIVKSAKVGQRIINLRESLGLEMPKKI